MYECYEHIVFPIWFNDLFGIPMAVEIFHNNSLWQSELLLIRWKLMQMSNVNKFVIHKCNIWCWSETINQSAAGDSEEMSCPSLGTESRQERNATPKPLHSQALFLSMLPELSELLSFAKRGVHGLSLAERVRWCRFCPLCCFCLIVWGWVLTSLFLKELFIAQRSPRLQSLILEMISYARYSSKLAGPLT